MRSFVIESDLPQFVDIEGSKLLMPHGWGNGYVVIPPGHPAYAIHYGDLNELISVHYGLTFAGHASNCGMFSLKEDEQDCWIVGFDTAHHGDTLEKWPKERVQIEADYLLSQLIDLKGTLPFKPIEDYKVYSMKRKSTQKALKEMKNFLKDFNSSADSQ